MDSPLVSVVIISYNSALYIEETLDSIFNQTYFNIELIISDDCSTDETVDICQKWIQKYGQRFVDVRLLSFPSNTGIPANCNRGVKAARGEWIKLLAGDDILITDAIDNYVQYISENREVKICFAYREAFYDEFQSQNFAGQDRILDKVFYGDQVTAKQQYRILLKMFEGSGPTAFYNAQSLHEIGLFDENYPLVEDYPLFIRYTKAGFKMYWMPKVTVYRRFHSDSVSVSRGKDAFFTNHEVCCILKYKLRYQYEGLNFIWKIFYYYSMFLTTLIIKTGNSKKNIICKALYVVFRVTDPFLWFARYQRFKNNN